VDVLGDVDQQRVVADRVAQPGIGSLAALVPGNVEPPRPAKAVGDDCVEVRRAGLLVRSH
jgi:hypothetical protein